MADNWKELVKRLKKGDKRALAKTITLIENETKEASKIIKDIYPETGKAKVIGITGPPGSGKSTLVDKIVDEMESKEAKIGVIAVDPSSPFTGGALLGDRARMGRRKFGENTFFRSMGTRGAIGGLSSTIPDVVKAMDVYGMDTILIETVGAGQNEVDIVETADSCIVVLMPKTGDEIQAMKAGILEIGDIYVVNKADLEGSEKTAHQIKTIVEMTERKEPTTHAEFQKEENSEDSPLKSEDEWTPPVLETVAKSGEGIEKLIETMEKHFKHLQKSGELREKRKERRRKEVMDRFNDIITGEIMEKIEEEKKLENLLEKVTVEKEIDPRTAAEKLISQIDLEKD